MLREAARQLLAEAELAVTPERVDELVVAASPLPFKDFHALIPAFSNSSRDAITTKYNITRKKRGLKLRVITGYELYA